MITRRFLLFVLISCLLKNNVLPNSDLSDASTLVKELFEKYGREGAIPMEKFVALLDNIGLAVHTDTLAQNKCPTPGQMLGVLTTDSSKDVQVKTFRDVCPDIVAQLDNEDCRSKGTQSSFKSYSNFVMGQGASITSNQSSTNQTIELKAKKTLFNIKPRVWIGSSIAVVIISLAGLAGVAVVPLVQKAFYHVVIQFLVALAVGTLTGDALLHLLPHAMMASEGGHGTPEPEHVHIEGEVHEDQTAHGHDELPMILKGLTALAGIFFFFTAEKILSLVSDHRAEKKAEEEERQRVLQNPRKSESRRLSMMGGSPVFTKDSSMLRRMSMAMSLSGDEFMATGLGSKALRSIDNIRRFSEMDSDDEGLDHELPNDVIGYNKSLTVPGVRPSPEGEHGDQNHEESVTIVVPQINSSPKYTPKMNSGGMKSSPEKKANTGEERMEMIPKDGQVEPAKQHGHGHGHSHEVPDSIAAVAWMVIMGDGLHNFTDGLAIGAAFAQGMPGGVSTAVAVFCHELPHELGDFAVLLKTGMKVKQALFYNVVSSILCFLGMIIGIALGNVEQASYWIFAIAGGTFVYIALVDMLPELSSANVRPGESRITHFFTQAAGICTGVGIMLTIAIFEGNIKTMLDGTEF